MAKRGRPTQHHGKWRIRWTDANGVRQSQVYKTYDEAELALEQNQLRSKEIRRGLRDASPRPRTFAQASGDWLEVKAWKASLKNDKSMLRCHLLPAFGERMLHEITTHEVGCFSNRLKAAPKTIGNILTLFISILNYAVENGWLAKAPRVHKPPISLLTADFRYLKTEEEIARLLAAARRRGENAYALYATAIYTGMRLGELAGLDWRNVDLVRRLITVSKSHTGPTKNRKTRHVPILDVLYPILKAWHARRCTKLVFPNKKGERLGSSPHISQEALHAMLADAAFPLVEHQGKEKRYIVFHDLRHTFASHWMMRGGTLFKLQCILGHGSPQMTMRYAHLAPNAFADDLGIMGPPLPVAEAVVL
jgi:integrase